MTGSTGNPDQSWGRLRPAPSPLVEEGGQAPATGLAPPGIRAVDWQKLRVAQEDEATNAYGTGPPAPVRLRASGSFAEDAPASVRTE